MEFQLAFVLDEIVTKHLPAPEMWVEMAVFGEGESDEVKLEMIQIQVTK